MNYVTSSFSHTTNSDLDYLFKKAVEHSSNRLKSNYEKIPEHLAYSIIYKNDKPVGCSLLQERKVFNGMGRVLSRLYFPAPQSKGLGHENYNHSQGLRPEIYEMLDQQIDLGIKFGIHDFFMSREDNTPIIMKKIHRGIRNHGQGWKIDTKNRYHVVGEHYQWVVWTGHNLLSQKDS